MGIQRLSFADESIDAVWITNQSRYEVQERTIVVNTSAMDLTSSAGIGGRIAPLKSTVLQRSTLLGVESAVLLRVVRTTNLGGIILGNAWQWFGKNNPSFPSRTPLYVSSQDAIGSLHIDPQILTRQTAVAGSPRDFDVKVNLWFTPENTDCVIHTGHKFFEVHTQVFGIGHMQKFRENDESTLYEDVPMAIGVTHDPFCHCDPDGHFNYPWHRYYADTDCIWMAVELHAKN